jgi:hypothetical protein
MYFYLLTLVNVSSTLFISIVSRPHLMTSWWLFQGHLAVVEAFSDILVAAFEGHASERFQGHLAGCFSGNLGGRFWGHLGGRFQRHLGGVSTDILWASDRTVSKNG